MRRLSLRWLGSALTLMLMLVCACNRAPEPPPSAAVSPAPAPGTQAAPTLPEPEKPSPERAGGLGFRAVAPLVARTPKSSMRAAEYGIEGDARSELTVFYFGPGQGGDLDANIARWLGQLSQPDGSDTAKQAKRAQRKVAGIEVTTIEARGRFSGGMAMPGAAAPAPIDDALMLGAIAVGPSGPVFFKLVGPSAAVERARAAFGVLVDSLYKL
jgi:hypothetical protein